QVQAAAANQQPGLAGAPVSAPLRFRVLHRDDRRMELTDKGYARKAVARALVAADVAADVVGLLSSGATLVRAAVGGAHTDEGVDGDGGADGEAGPDGDGHPDGRGRPGDPLKPGDVAVLVFTHREAAVVHEALDSLGVPAVISGGGSVFGTEIAAQWLRLLHALERPDSSGRARAAALTWFVGWDAARVASAGDEEIGDLQARLHHWAAVLVERGVAALLELITATEGLPARMLGHDGGERQLTDLRHVGQLLHAEAVGSQLGTTALTGWLRRRISEAAEDNTTEERSRRLESDADAVQVMTVHRSKGLEWPVVYVPYLWCKGPDEREPIPVYHDPGTGRRTVDVGGRGGPMAPTHRDLYMDERRGEDLRLAYVALTRARHQAVVWWAGAYESRDSSLLRLVLADPATGQLPNALKKPPPDREVEGRLEAMALGAPGCISVERCREMPARQWDAARGTTTDLGVCS
ncbi:MAG: 3'-5' exonuclease, partial [Acidimicrobiales bacterium]